MLQKIYSRLHLILVRFSFYFLFKHKESKLKEKGSFEDVNTVIKNYRESLIRGKNLNEDLTKGPISVKTKNGQKLVSSFITNQNNQDEKDFYIQVAKEWGKGYEQKFHKASLLFIILFLLWWASGIFLSQYISNITGLLFLIGIFLFPILGFVFAGLGKGWKKWLLAAINVFFFIVFVMIVF